MRKANRNQLRRAKAVDRHRRLESIDALEQRCLLAPIPLFGTTYESGARDGTDPSAGIAFDGFVSARLISTQSGRIEADPTGDFGGDVFVISRGTGAGTSGGLLSSLLGGTPDVAGNIYRVDPYGSLGAGLGLTNTASSTRLFATIPGNGGTLGFSGYTNWYDLAFDTNGAYDGLGGGTTLFVSTSDATSTGGVNVGNAIYALDSNGNPVNSGLFNNIDANLDGLLDNSPSVLAVAPNDSFGDQLYVFDAHCNNDPGIDCVDGDGNAAFRIDPALAAGPLVLEFSGTQLTNNVEALIPAPVDDIDPVGMAFDPNRGIIVQGQFGEQAFQIWGGLVVASSDVDDTGLTRFLHFPTPFSQPIDLITPIPTSAQLIGDIAFDPVGHFGGGVFFTDYVTGTVGQLLQDPTTGITAQVPILTNFNVASPALGAVTEAEALLEPFSISFSADGEIMYVSDRDGVWAIYANTLANTPAGAVLGLTDARELGVPYTGSGFAAGVIDTGVDGNHLGFRGTVAPGINPTLPLSGNLDFGGHGTATAGIIHQIVPDAVIVPVNGLSGLTTDSTFTNQELWESVKFFLDNPYVDDPRTFERERVPIVTVNMSLGVTSLNPDNDRNAMDMDLSIAAPLKSVFNGYYSANQYGIVPVASAGNEGQLFNGMSGAGIPGVLNEVVEVAATYSYGPSFAVGSFVGSLFPPTQAPPVALDGTRCTLEAGDLISYIGKLTAFSSRSVSTDYAAAGSCVSTYSPTGFLGPIESINPGVTVSQALAMAPINATFNGTSAAAPVVAGSFVFGFDLVHSWAQVAKAGGRINPNSNNEAVTDLHSYLIDGIVSDFTDPADQAALRSSLSLGRIPNFNAYLNADGVNALLQWSSIPREDSNIGESLSAPAGTDDDVIQEREVDSNNYRTYSHSTIAGMLAVVEGSVAIKYFQNNPAHWRTLAASAGNNQIVTGSDIEAYLQNKNQPVEARAMARLLGGTSKIAHVNRMTFLDLTQDGRQDGGIRTSSLNTLAARILPGPNEFEIRKRHNSAGKAFAVNPTAEHYHDLGVLLPSHQIGTVPAKERGKSPDEFKFGTQGTALVSTLPGNDGLTGGQEVFVIGDSSDIPTVATDDGLGNTDFKQVRSNNNIVAVDSGASESLFKIDENFDLIQYQEAGNGSYSMTNLTQQTGHEIRRDVITLESNSHGTMVYGLTHDGQVVQYRQKGESWRASNVSAQHRLPAMKSGLTGESYTYRGRTNTVLYGLNVKGQLIEYRNRGRSWTYKNLAKELGVSRLKAGLSVEVDVSRARERIYVYATNRTGKALEFAFNGRQWSNRTLPATVLPGTLVAAFADGEKQAFAINRQGELIRMYMTGARWRQESLSRLAIGPRLRGEISVDVTNRGLSSVVGTDMDGRVIQYNVNQNGRWTWRHFGGETMAGSDVAVGARSVFVESVDNVLNEFDLSSKTWRVLPS